MNGGQDNVNAETLDDMNYHQECHIKEGTPQQRILHRLALTLLAGLVNFHQSFDERLQFVLGRARRGRRRYQKKVEGVDSDNVNQIVQNTLDGLLKV